jgi:peptidoglycan hydrolase-like protein with peptidoglycan-binding domain
MAIDRSGSNDISDVRPNVSNTIELSPTQLPIRGEKRIIPTPINTVPISNTIRDALGPNAQTTFSNGRTQLIEPEDFLLKAAMEPFVDFVVIRVPNRGVDSTGHPNANLPAVYRFLINPAQVQISRTTLDGQAFARGGWQIGVWGEDAIQISLVGKTAGQYWSFGRTDNYQYFTESYRNLLQLQMVFENNGYWFEGEQAAEGPLAADFTRRRIKMHQDVELIVGNFMWRGMFDTLTITQSAEEPWLASFNITFVAWKERFRSGSPYQNQLRNDTQRGHSYDLWATSANSAAKGIPFESATPVRMLPPTQVVPFALLIQPVEAPTTTSELQSQILPNIDPTTVDYSPMQNVLNSGLPQFTNYWNGVK